MTLPVSRVFLLTRIDWRAIVFIVLVFHGNCDSVHCPERGKEQSDDGREEKKQRLTDRREGKRSILEESANCYLNVNCLLFFAVVMIVALHLYSTVFVTKPLSFSSSTYLAWHPAILFCPILNPQN